MASLENRLQDMDLLLYKLDNEEWDEAFGYADRVIEAHPEVGAAIRSYRLAKQWVEHAITAACERLDAEAAGTADAANGTLARHARDLGLRSRSSSSSRGG